jgi:hypothetical protein
MEILSCAVSSCKIVCSLSTFRVRLLAKALKIAGCDGNS